MFVNLSDLLTSNSIIGFAVGAAVSVGLLAIGHWVPLPAGQKSKLPTTLGNLLGRYIYGVTALWLGSLIWLSMMGAAWIAVGLLLIYGGGGAIVILAYWWDRLVIALNREEMMELVDNELTAQSGQR